MDIRQLIIDNEEKLILEKNRLDYFSNQYKTTFDMNYSPKLATKYHLTDLIIPVNRCLIEQKPFKQKKKSEYNLRRLHQLYINIARFDFAHQWTLFNHDFLSAYLLCGEYKLSDLLYQFSIGALDPEGELRFLLKQLESSMSILDQYPTNLSFELIYRLFPFYNQLPELTSNLLEKCLTDCPLRLITDNQRIQSLAKYPISNIIYLSIDEHRLLIGTSEEKFYLFSYNYYGLLRTGFYDINYKKKEDNEKISSFLCNYPYICCLSTSLSMIVINCETKQISMQISCRKLISFVNKEIVLVISSSNDSLQLWNCSTNTLVTQYDIPDSLINGCIFKDSIIKVNFQQSPIISYFSIDKNFQFNSLRIFNENINNHTHHLLLDAHTVFYYSYDRSQTSLIIYNDDNSQETHDIDFNTLPKSVLPLSQTNSIVWLTSTSVILFHPLIEEKLFQPFAIYSSIEYDVVHDHHSSTEFRDQSNFLACMNKNQQIIDIYEWRFEEEEKQFHYRQLTRLQLDIITDQFVFRASM